MRRYLLLAAGVLSMLGAWVAPARAQEGNYQDFPLGDRAAGLGGAFTALADDGTAAWYNPGGLAFVREGSFSITATVYAFSRGTIDNQFNTGVDANFGFLSTVPSVVTTTETFSDATFTFAVFKPKAIDIRQRDALPTPPLGANPSATLFFDQQNQHNQLWIGPSLAFPVSNRLGVGVSVFGVQVETDGTRTEDRAEYDAGGVLQGVASTNAGFHATSYFLTIQIGALYRLTPRWSVGMSVRSEGLNLGPLFSVGGDAFFTSDDPFLGTQQFVVESNLDTNYHVPWRFALGLAYKEPGFLALAFDVNIYPPVGRYDIVEPLSALLNRESREGVAVVDVNLGAEFTLSDSIALRVGLYTNLPPEPVTNPGAGRSFGSITFTAATLGFGFTGEHTVTNITIGFSGGQGTFVSGTTTQNVTMSTIFIVFGGSVFF